MREEFEKLPSVEKYLKFVFWDSETKGYCNNSGNPAPLDFASFINGAYYTYQEQQKKIDSISKYLIDSCGFDKQQVLELLK